MEELVASVIFADAFDCRLSCSGTHADIGRFGPAIGNVDDMLWTIYFIIILNYQLYSTQKNSSSASNILLLAGFQAMAQAAGFGLVKFQARPKAVSSQQSGWAWLGFFWPGLRPEPAHH